MSEIIKVKLETQTINRKKLTLSLNGFILNYMNKNYVITVHHNLPIDSVLHENSVEIVRNSGWSEILICSTNELNLREYKINRSIKNTIPKNNETLILKSDIDYEMRTIGYDFLPFDNIHENLLIPYIKAKFITCVDRVQGLSGSPIFMNNKLVGIFSKYNMQDQSAYIIPIYLVIKNLEKVDFVNIYCSPTIDINKINSYNVKENMIYHPTLKINVPVSTYFILEGDINCRFVIQSGIDYRTYDSLPTMNIEMDIINKDDQYKINFRLLTLINKFNTSKEIIMQLLNSIRNDEENWLSINENNITLVR